MNIEKFNIYTTHDPHYFSDLTAFKGRDVHQWDPRVYFADSDVVILFSFYAKYQ